MATFTTKQRLAQMTGTFGADSVIGQVNDQLSQSATGSINAANLSVILSHMASAIKRIHGASSFSEQVTGTFSQNVFFPDNVKAYYGNNLNFSIFNNGSDTSLSSSNGNVTIAGSTISLAGSTIQPSAGASIKPGAGDLTIAGGLGGGTLTLTSNNGNPGSATFKLGGLTIEATGSLTPGANSNNLGASGNPWATLYVTNVGQSSVPLYLLGNVYNSGTLVQAGVTNLNGAVYTAGDLNVSGNLNVSGVVTGTVMTINSVNLTIEDPVVLLANNAVSSNTNGGLAILSGSSVADESLVFGRVDNDTWGVGRLDVQGGTITSLAGMTHTNIRANQYQIDGSSAYLGLSAANVVLVSADDIVLQPGGSDVLVDGNLVPTGSSGGTLGSFSNQWPGIYLSNGSTIDFDNGTSTLLYTTGSDNTLTLSGAILIANNGVEMSDLGTDPTTPSSGYGMFYVKSDKPYFIDDAGTTYDLSLSGSSASVAKTQVIVTGTIAANAVTTVGSTAHDSLPPDQLDIYVNGSLMLSGAAVSGSVAANADYSLDELTGSNVRFAFELVATDVIVMKKLVV